MDWSLQVRITARMGQTGLAFSWDVYKKLRDVCFSTLDMFTNLRFFSVSVIVFLILLRFYFKFYTLLFIYIEYLLCAKFQTRSQTILSVKLLLLRSPMISYLSNPLDIFKPSEALTALCDPAYLTSLHF